MLTLGPSLLLQDKMLKRFPKPPTDRYFEDYEVGTTYECGSFTVTEAEIIAFATEHDPQTMHTDPASVGAAPFGGVIASGWHTISRTMRLFVDNFLPHDGLPAPGIDELRWPNPVRPGDALALFVTVEQARRSRSRPDRGLVHLLMEVKNQSGDLVMSMKPMNFIRVREPA